MKLIYHSNINTIVILVFMFLIGCATLPPDINDIGSDEVKLFNALKEAHSVGSIYIGWNSRGGKYEYINDLKEKILTLNPDWSDSIKNEVRIGKVSKGMVQKQVLLSIGYPIDKELRVYDGTKYETWLYEDVENVREYIEIYELEFEDGLLDNWTEYYPQEYPNITVGYELGKHDLNEIRID